MAEEAAGAEEHIYSEPEEDSGAPTQDRFRFQHHCAARHLLLAIYDKVNITVICEWHADLLILRDGQTEAVSVKHRELSAGAFTASSIVDDGGLEKLFETWKASKEQLSCRLMTNQGFKGGKTGAARIVNFRSLDAAEKAEVATALKERLPAATDTDEVARFLSVFVVDGELPRRRHIAHEQRNLLLGPAYAALGEAPDARESEYDALMDFILKHSADPDELTFDLGLAIAAAGDEHQMRALRAKVGARSITTEQAANCLREARHEPIATLPAVTVVQPETRMRDKLRAGKLNSTQVNLAAHLRNAWYAAEAEERETAGFAREFSTLKALVLREAGAAQAEGIKHGPPYGQEMLDDLRERLAAAKAPARRQLVHPDLLEGLAYELTDICEVWWSPEEDVEGVDGGS